MPVERIISIAVRGALAIVVIAFIVQLGIGFSPVYLRFVEVVLVAVTVVPIAITLVVASLGLSAFIHRRTLGRLLATRAAGRPRS